MIDLEKMHSIKTAIEKEFSNQANFRKSYISNVIPINLNAFFISSTFWKNEASKKELTNEGIYVITSNFSLEEKEILKKYVLEHIKQALEGIDICKKTEVDLLNMMETVNYITDKDIKKLNDKNKIIELKEKLETELSATKNKKRLKI